MNDENHPTDVHVGQRMRTLRKGRGMSQERLAEAAAVTFQQVQKYERGDNRISASRLWQFAKALEVDVGYFFEGLDDPPEAKEHQDRATWDFATSAAGQDLLAIARHLPRALLEGHTRLMGMQVGCITDMGVQIIAAKMGEG